MEQRELDDRDDGHIQTRVQPDRDPANILVSVNDHFDYSRTWEKQQHPSAREITGKLQERFDASISRSEWIIDQVMKLAEVS